MGRTLGPFSKMGTFLLEIFKQYNWDRVALVASNYLMWNDAARSIRIVFTENNITIPFEKTYDRYPTNDFIRRTLDTIQEEARSK